MGNLEDFGNISDAPIDEEDALGFNPNDYGLIVYTGVVYPFGSIADIQVEEKSSSQRLYLQSQWIHTSYRVQERYHAPESAPKQGSNTLFEIGGLERLVIPDLGAVRPSPTLSGESVTSNTFTEVGSGTLTVSEDNEFNIYPFESRITLTVSGEPHREYPDEYIEVRPNEETLTVHWMRVERMTTPSTLFLKNLTSVQLLYDKVQVSLIQMLSPLTLQIRM